MQGAPLIVLMVGDIRAIKKTVTIEMVSSHRRADCTD